MEFKVDMQGDFWVWQAHPAGDSHSADGMLAVSFFACWEGLSVAMVMVPGWIGGCVNVGCIHIYNLLLNSFWLFPCNCCPAVAGYEIGSRGCSSDKTDSMDGF